MISNFARLLYRLRLEAGLSQESLAERAGLSVNAIGAYEQGLRHAPRPSTIAALSAALKLSREMRIELEESTNRKSSSTSLGHNLPWQATSFIGRDSEVEGISSLLAPRRLVTITGAGGIGKTRTAFEVASRLSQPPRDGIWFIDLAPLTDGTFAIGKIAAVLALQLADQDDLLSGLVRGLKARELLLILDNCEHIIGTIRSVAEMILQSCPKITLLATSRERLDISGEVTFQLSTLPIPAQGATSAAEARSYGALELFVDRAATSKRDFIFADDHVEAVVDICRRLDGVALAIELAAARLPMLGLSELRTQLSKHFGLVASLRRDIPVRQQTLHATIDWSYALLGEPEQILFHRLAVFANGWTLEAAETVCADAELGKSAVLDALMSLTEKSLVVADIDSPVPRYSFFESTRAYAADLLARSTDGAALSRRYTQWMATFADRAYDLYFAVPRLRWERAMTPEVDNAIAALELALGPEGDAVLAGRIASGLQGFWYGGLAVYGRRCAAAVLERIDAEHHPVLVARLLLSQFQFLHGAAYADALKRAISLLKHADDRQTLATCYSALAFVLSQTSEHSETQAASDRALALLREDDVAGGASVKRSSLYAKVLGDRSAIFRKQGRVDEAKAVLTEALAIADGLEDDWSISWFQIILADIEFDSGNALSAAALAEEALASARRVRGVNQEIYSLCNLASYQLVLGEIGLAEMNARSALGLAHNSNPNVVQAAIQHLAAVAALRGQASRAALLLGYSNAWYERVGCPRDSTDQKGFDILMESLRKQLSDDEIAAFAAQGATLTEEVAVAEALNISLARPE